MAERGAQTEQGGGDMQKRIILIIALALTVGGCAASRTITQDDDAVCKSMGASPGTNAYVQCRLAQQARRDAAHRDIGDRLQRAGAAMQSLDPPPTRGMHCTSTPMLGGSRDIDCY
jgi:hypothetical protein